MDEIFTCVKCKQGKQLSEFPVHKRKGKSRRRSECRVCFNTYYREYLNNSKHKLLVSKKYYNNSKFVSDIKIKSGCVICGYNRCSSALEFHHLDRNTKNANVAHIVKCKTDIIMNEIAKCVILCANCHRELEYGLIELPVVH